MQVDANKVIEKLLHEIAQLNMKIATYEVLIDTLKSKQEVKGGD